MSADFARELDSLVDPSLRFTTLRYASLVQDDVLLLRMAFFQCPVPSGRDNRSQLVRTVANVI